MQCCLLVLRGRLGHPLSLITPVMPGFAHPTMLQRFTVALAVTGSPVNFPDAGRAQPDLQHGRYAA
jgi:hypothetical protein